jgi:hypothetical protein
MVSFGYGCNEIEYYRTFGKMDAYAVPEYLFINNWNACFIICPYYGNYSIIQPLQGPALAAMKY